MPSDPSVLPAGLVPDIFAVVPPPTADAFAVVGDASDYAYRQFLRALNQKRDTALRKLRRPLFWVGTPEFVLGLWENAPDFYSVRGVPIMLQGAAPERPER